MPKDQVPWDWNQMDYHMYLSPQTSQSVDTIGRLKNHKSENSFVIVVVDKFSKIVSVQKHSEATAFLNSHQICTQDLFGLLSIRNCSDILPPGEWIVECYIKEVMNHLRYLDYDN